MATTMRHHHEHLTTPRTLTQKVCIGLGIIFVLVGLGGIVMPGMLGMHLSLLHNIIHLSSGTIAIWAGYADDYKKAYNFCIAFGAVYGLLGISGFVFGSPGYPGVGNMEADRNLLRIIPNALEFGTMDHIIHVIIGGTFLMSAVVWKRKENVTGRAVVNEQGRVYKNHATHFHPEHHRPTDVFRAGPDFPNSMSDLKDADLGDSDINRRTDYSRRHDFERRI